jgi:hypothetical protein
MELNKALDKYDLPDRSADREKMGNPAKLQRGVGGHPFQRRVESVALESGPGATLRIPYHFLRRR